MEGGTIRAFDIWCASQSVSTLGRWPKLQEAEEREVREECFLSIPSFPYVTEKVGSRPRYHNQYVSKTLNRDWQIPICWFRWFRYGGFDTLFQSYSTQVFETTQPGAANYSRFRYWSRWFRYGSPLRSEPTQPGATFGTRPKPTQPDA